jgi:phosphoserine phosphatase
MKYYSFVIAICLLLFVACNQTSKEVNEEVKTETTEALASWNEGETKSAIINFVKEVTDSNSPNFVEVADRIATFDNDGNLWSEQPYYFQIKFALDQIKVMAPDHPEWEKDELFQAALNNDFEAIVHSGKKGLVKLMMTAHAGMNTDEFAKIVDNWISTAQHPKTGKLYKEMIYQPMVELIAYLQANGFKTFIVSGGGIEFMRPWVEEAYGIPQDQVIGSSIKTEYDYNNGNPIIKRLPEIDFIDDKEGKPEGINRFIGRKPIFASGNSDGDLQMMRWAASNELKSFMLYVHHTDSVREWAYDRESHIGRLDKGLDEAMDKGWTVIDMEKDWKVIYPWSE